MQQSLVKLLDENNGRKIKPSVGEVFLMKKIATPAVTIECGFLSNPAELALLKTDQYKKKIAAAITAGYVNYLAGK